jgi:hypothetical protein
MKAFLKNFAMAIPLALGTIFTIFSIVNAIAVLHERDSGFIALICGLIGIPLLYASVISLLDRN